MKQAKKLMMPLIVALMMQIVIGCETTPDAPATDTECQRLRYPAFDMQTIDAATANDIRFLRWYSEYYFARCGNEKPLD